MSLTYQFPFVKIGYTANLECYHEHWSAVVDDEHNDSDIVDNGVGANTSFGDGDVGNESIDSGCGIGKGHGQGAGRGRGEDMDKVLVVLARHLQ